MIRPLAALTRQVQEFFHKELIGIFVWDDILFSPPEKNETPQTSVNRRGRRHRPERAEGKYHAMLQIEFGIWRLKVEGPTEHPPLGWLTLDAADVLEGPLDAATWKQFGSHIRKKHEEIKNVA
jgi:hypothetical protein